MSNPLENANKSLENAVKDLVGTAESLYSPLIVAGLKAALARITALEKQVEAVLTPKVVPIPPVPNPTPVPTTTAAPVTK
jgi:hypothetical protein